MTGRRIRTASGPLDARVRAVPSKSVTHRALVAAALASGRSVLLNPLEADDTVVTRNGIRTLGVPLVTQDGAWIVEGGGGTLLGGGTIELGASGTSFRFLLALASLGKEPSRLEGSARLAERPIRELADALRVLGGDVQIPPKSSLPAISGGRCPSGGNVRIRGAESSQFASALLSIGARLPGGLTLTLDAEAVSLPYVRLTAEVLGSFGVPITRDGDRRFRVESRDYRGREYRIEGDHSSASYFLAAAAIVGGVVRVDLLRSDSFQPDAVLPTLLEDLGCAVSRGPDWVEVCGTGRIGGFALDVTHSPDLAPTLAAIALFAEGPCELRGIEHLRSKESDRVEVLAANLRSLGRDAMAAPSALRIGPPSPESVRGATVRTSSDHRIAMAFAIAGLRLPGVVIDDVDCVSKSNPAFWEAFAGLEDGPTPIRTGS